MRKSAVDELDEVDTDDAEDEDTEAGFQQFERFLEEWSRRDFLKRAGGAAAYLTFLAGVCVGASALLKFRRPKIKFVPLEPSITVNIGMITKREGPSPQLDEFRGLVKEALALCPRLSARERDAVASLVLRAATDADSKHSDPLRSLRARN